MRDVPWEEIDGRDGRDGSGLSMECLEMWKD